MSNTKIFICGSRSSAQQLKTRYPKSTYEYLADDSVNNPTVEYKGAWPDSPSGNYCDGINSVKGNYLLVVRRKY